MRDETWPTTHEVAAQLQVSPETIRRYLRRGLLSAEREGATKHGRYRIDPAAISAFLRELKAERLHREQGR